MRKPAEGNSYQKYTKQVKSGCLIVTWWSPAGAGQFASNSADNLENLSRLNTVYSQQKLLFKQKPWHSIPAQNLKILNAQLFDQSKKVED